MKKMLCFSLLTGWFTFLDALTAASKPWAGQPYPSCAVVLKDVILQDFRNRLASEFKYAEEKIWAEVDSRIHWAVFGGRINRNRNVFSGAFAEGPFLIEAAINARLEPLRFGAKSSDAYRERLAGKSSEKAVLVHLLSEALQDEAAQWMEQPEIKDVPRLIVVSRSQPLRSVGLRERATKIEYSSTGAFQSTINADELFVLTNDYQASSAAIQIAVESSLESRDTMQVVLELSFLQKHFAPQKELEGEYLRSVSDRAFLGKEMGAFSRWTRIEARGGDLPTVRYERRTDHKTVKLVWKP